MYDHNRSYPARQAESPGQCPHCKAPIETVVAGTAFYGCGGKHSASGGSCQYPGLLPRDYAEAILVQDACNLSGVLHSWARIQVRIQHEVPDTQSRNRHPINVLYAAKVADLSHGDGPGAFGLAHKLCKERGHE